MKGSKVTELTIALRDWRGKRFQKQAADELGVPLRTYISWEAGTHTPPRICRKCIMAIIHEMEIGKSA